MFDFKPSDPTCLRVPRTRLLLLVLGFALLTVILMPRPAYAAAASYTVEDCGTFGNTGTFTFGRSNTALTGGASDCGGGTVGLELGAQSVNDNANVALGDRAVWQFDAPAGETITGLGIENGSYRSDDGWIAGWAANSVINPDPLPASDACVAQPQRNRCSVQSSGWFGIPNAHNIELMIRCDETSTASVRYCPTDSADVGATVGATVVQLTDPSPPTITVTGSLWNAAGGNGAAAPAWISGIDDGSGLNLSYAATNPAGICTLRATLTNGAGIVVDSSTESAQAPATDPGLGTLLDTSAPFRSRLPCGAASSGTGLFDPDLATLPTGTYRLDVEAQDPTQYQSGVGSYAVGSDTADGLPIAIDNSVPSVVIDAPGVDAAGSQSVTVTATDASGSSGLERLTCDVEGTERSYAIAGDSATVDVPLATTPSGGSTDSLETLSCQASSVAGNVSATRTLTLERAASRLTATVSAAGRRVAVVASGGRPAAVQLAHGQIARISGRLIAGAGASAAGARVTISQRVFGATASTVLARVTAGAHGGFSLRLPAGPSRELMLSFDGSPTLRATAAQARVSVAGAVRLSLPQAPRAGRAVILSGRVLGGHLPHSGVLVQLWYAVSGAAWEPFEHAIHTARDGAFHLRVPIAAAAAGRTYRIRAVVAAQGGWPYMRAISKTVTRTFR